MKHASLFTFALLLALAGCGRKPPVAGQAATADAPPASASDRTGAPAGAPVGAPSPAPTGSNAPPAANALTPAQTAALAAFPPVNPHPSPTQRTAMAAELARGLKMIGLAKQAVAQVQAQCVADQKARQAKAQAEYEAQLAQHKADLEIQWSQAKAKWEATAAEFKAQLAKPGLSESDKMDINSFLARGFVPPADLAQGAPMPPSTTTHPLPAAPVCDPQATRECDALICKFHQAMAAHDHPRALKAMQAINALAPKVSPALLASYVASAQRLLEEPDAADSPAP